MFQGRNMDERQLTAEALAALVNWPTLFGRHLHDETIRIVEKSNCLHPLELADVEQALDQAFQRLKETVRTEFQSRRSQDEQRRDAA
jgi:hypothetical protein